MDINTINVELRPRTTWESIDLGVRFLQQWFKPMFLAWFIITLPVFLLLSGIFYWEPIIGITVFWWLLPLWERILLHILSQAIFGHTPSLRETLRAFPQLCGIQTFLSLTWRRLSPSRAFNLPIIQLEKLHGKDRRRRIQVLHQTSTGAVTLFVYCSFLVTLIYFTFILVHWLFTAGDHNLLDYFEDLAADPSSVTIWFFNFYYYLTLSFVAFIYVPCGFSLYLNRRSILEGWDIDVQFQRIAARLEQHKKRSLPARSTTKTLIFFLCICSVHFWHPREAHALRLMALTKEEAQTKIKETFEDEKFHQKIKCTAWSFYEECKDDEQPKPEISEPAKNEFSLPFLDISIEAILWIAIIGLLILFIWKYRGVLAQFSRAKPKKSTAIIPETLFGLDIRAESLPENIADTVWQLWQNGETRKALSLLYRATLSQLIQHYSCEFHDGHTEGDCLRIVKKKSQADLSVFFQTLISTWQKLAYGKRLPADATVQQLCQQWKVIFNHGN